MVSNVEPATIAIFAVIACIVFVIVIFTLATSGGFEKAIRVCGYTALFVIALCCYEIVAPQEMQLTRLLGIVSDSASR